MKKLIILSFCLLSIFACQPDDKQETLSITKSEVSGVYNSTQNIKGYTPQTDIFIDTLLSGNGDTLLIGNFHNLGKRIKATLSGTNIKIHNQSISGNNIYGTGIFETKTKFKLDYYFNDGIKNTNYEEIHNKR
jgi:hypothetical protein